MKRVTGRYGELVKYFGAQRQVGTDKPEMFRGFRQEMDPVIEHVRHTAQKVNEAPFNGNRNRHEYIGSIPIAILIDWLNKNGYQLDQYARNDEGRNGLGISDEFKAWFLKNPDLSKFKASTHTHRIKRVYG